MLQGDIGNEGASGESTSPQHRTEDEAFQRLHLSVVCVVGHIVGSSNCCLTTMESSPENVVFVFCFQTSSRSQEQSEVLQGEIDNEGAAGESASPQQGNRHRSTSTPPPSSLVGARKIVIIAHSQGSIVVANALQVQSVSLQEIG